MTKRMISLVLALLLCLSLAACGSNGGQASGSTLPAGNSAGPESQEPEVGSETPAPSDDVDAPSSETPQPGESPEPEEETSRVLVAYFSRVGVTPFDDGVDAVTSASLNIRDGELVGNMQYLAEYVVEATGGDLHQIITEKEYPADYRDTTDLASEEQASDERPALTSQVEDMDQYDVVFLGFPNWWGTLPQAVVTFLERYDFSGKTIVPFCSHGGSRLGSGPRDIAALCPEATLLDGLAVSGSDAANARDEVADWVAGLGMEF